MATLEATEISIECAATGEEWSTTSSSTRDQSPDDNECIIRAKSLTEYATDPRQLDELAQFFSQQYRIEPHLFFKVPGR